MSPLTRRSFLLVSSGAAAGNMWVSSAQSAEREPLDFSTSGLVTGRPKPLSYTAIPGFLSAEQIAPHHTAHYGGALRGYSGIDAALEEATKAGKPIDPFAYGAMQREKSSKGNSVLLHELYFDGMAPKDLGPKPEILRAIEDRFGSLDRWAEDFQASARAAAGWALLVVHAVNGKLYNVVSDEHASGPLWMSAPLVVIDVYEHAFYIDYQNRKADYVKRFMEHIDWEAANRRYRAAVG